MLGFSLRAQRGTGRLLAALETPWPVVSIVVNILDAAENVGNEMTIADPRGPMGITG